MRKKPINENAFSQITPASAYWIGFMMADGHIRDTRNSIRLNLASRDRFHIEKFKSFLESGHKITDSSYITKHGTLTFSSSIEIRNKRLMDDLIAYGVTSKKSHTATTSGKLLTNLDFWRGVIDGDGCLFRNTDNTAGLFLIGSFTLVNQFKDFVEYLGIPPRAKVQPKSNVFTYRVGGNKAIKVLRHCYGSKPIYYLDRKHTKALSFIS